MYKIFKIKNPWAINPFIGYGSFWVLAIFLYIISPSEMNLRLNETLFVFLALTILGSYICAYFFNKKFRNKQYKIYLCKPSKLLILGLLTLYIIEFFYSGQIPLFQTLFGNGSAYKNFGLPFFHVLIVTVSVFFGLYHALMFFVFKKLYSFGFVAMIFLYFIMAFSRGLIIFFGVCCFILYFVNKKIRFSHIIVALFIFFAAGWLFGILGNIRSGSSWNDTGYLLSLAKIEADPFGAFSPLYWVEEYIICSLRNLNYNVTYMPKYSLEGFLYTIIPDFIAKRIFSAPVRAELIIPAFTTSTMYAETFVNGGYFGMLISFLLYLVLVKVVMWICKNDVTSQLVCCSILFFLYAMSIFDNMVVYSGYSFSIAIGLCFGLWNTRQLSGAKLKAAEQVQG